jgi:hypothetical protein
MSAAETKAGRGEPGAGTATMPNLLVIGAAKSGTTSLHRYLDQHPEVTMAVPHRSDLRSDDNDAHGKEMRFFWRDDWRERLDWYRSHFAAIETPVRGEATPAYTAYPFHPDVAERIHSVAPGARLVYLVRDPVERVLAHQVQRVVDGDRASLAERLRDDRIDSDPAICPSRYATQLERYLRLFPSSQIEVVDQHRLRHERRQVMREIYAFAGVDPDFWSPTLEREHNTRSQKHALTPAGRRLFHGLLAPAGRRIAPRAWGKAAPRVRRARSEPVGSGREVDPEVRGALTELLRPEAERLRGLTGQDFSSWSV